MNTGTKMEEMKYTEQPDWGSYKPKTLQRLLRIPTRLGIGRGKITGVIHRRWCKLHGSIIDISVRGINYRLNICDNMTDIKILSSSRIYDGEEIRFLKQVCDNGTFVDLGANIGYYSLALAQAGATSVLSIEPNPPTLDRLRFNISINNFNTEIKIAPIGVGEDGRVQFYSTGDLGCASLLKQECKKTAPITIQTRPLLEILNSHNLTEIDGMKVDIEGMEDRALIPFYETAPQGLWPKRLVIEHAHRDEWENDLINYLLNQGYQQFKRTRANTLLEKNPIG